MKHDCTITSQIESVNETIIELKKRISKLEKNISHESIENKKTAFELELVEIKKLIKTNEDQLSGLHKENSKTFIIAAIVIFIFFLVYGFYCLIFGY